MCWDVRGWRVEAGRKVDAAVQVGGGQRLEGRGKRRLKAQSK